MLNPVSLGQDFDFDTSVQFCILGIPAAEKTVSAAGRLNKKHVRLKKSLVTFSLFFTSHLSQDGCLTYMPSFNSHS